MIVTSTSGIRRLMFGVGEIQVLRAGQGKTAARDARDARDASHAKGGERRSFAPRDSVEESVSRCQPKLYRKGQELLMARNPEGRLNILKPFKSETIAQYCIDSPTLIEP